MGSGFLFLKGKMSVPKPSCAQLSLASRLSEQQERALGAPSPAPSGESSPVRWEVICMRGADEARSGRDVLGLRTHWASRLGRGSGSGPAAGLVPRGCLMNAPGDCEQSDHTPCLPRAVSVMTAASLIFNCGLFLCQSIRAWMTHCVPT